MSNYKHIFQNDLENLKLSVKTVYGITREDEDKIFLKIDELRNLIFGILEERKV